MGRNSFSTRTKSAQASWTSGKSPSPTIAIIAAPKEDPSVIGLDGNVEDVSNHWN